MNTEILGIGIGFCFTAIMILFIFLLTKDSELFRKKKKEHHVKEAVKKAANPVERMFRNKQGIAAELPMKATIYYRMPDQRAYKEVCVKTVPFKIGAIGSGADLELDDYSVLDKHAVLYIEDSKQECSYVLKNYANKLYTDYLDQDGEKPEWVKVDKNDKVILQNPREAFYFGNTKLLIDIVSVERSVSKSDVDLFCSAGVDHKEKKQKDDNYGFFENDLEEQAAAYTGSYRRTPSDRAFEENVLDVDDICC